MRHLLPPESREGSTGNAEPQGVADTPEVTAAEPAPPRGCHLRCSGLWAVLHSSILEGWVGASRVKQGEGVPGDRRAFAKTGGGS